MTRLRLLASLACLMAAFPLPGQSQEAPAAKCRYEHLGTLPVRYHGVALLPVTDGEINGSPATMRLAFAARTLLTRFGVDRRKLLPTVSRNWVATTGGDSRVYAVNVQSLGVGPLRTNRVGTLKMIDDPVRADYDAFLGGEFLLQRDLEVSLAEKQIKFFKPDNCANAFLAYWDQNAVQLPLETESDGVRPTFEVQLDGLTLTALIDPQSTYSSVSMAALRKLGLSAASAGMAPYGDPGAPLRSYRYRFKKFSMAHEAIENPELVVTEHASTGIDMMLGADFLRTHRVLLARSQRKIYLSYIGGTPFTTGVPEEWVVREAEQGNGYAQYQLALRKARQPAVADAWLDKAVEQSNPLALRRRAEQLQRAGKTAEAVPLLERALAQDPFDVPAQLQLFRARMQAGQLEQASAALLDAVKRHPHERWPLPLADYYLGKLTVEEVIEEAASEKPLARRRRCETYAAAQQLAEARSQPAVAAQWRARGESECRVTPPAKI